jgi:hypothetical protein
LWGTATASRRFAATPARYKPLGFQQISAASLATVQTLTVPPGANVAIIKANVAAVSWRDDGVAPTSAIGMQMLNTDPPLEYSGFLSALQFILVTGGSPTVNVSYYPVPA